MRATELAEAIARLETRYGTHAVVRGDVAVRQDAERRIETRGALDAVAAVRAGEPVALVGPVTAGKTALARALVAASQREGGMAAWLDPTASFDPLAALRSGVDLDRLVVVRPRGADELLLAGSATLRSEGYRLVVVDLGPAFCSSIRIDDLASLLPVVRGSPAALAVVAERRGTRVALPLVSVEPLAWCTRFGRTVGWTFAAGVRGSAERALFTIGALDERPTDLGTRSALAELEQAS